MRYSGDISIDSNGNSILPQGLSQAMKHGMHKPRFIEFTCSYIEVCSERASKVKVIIRIGFPLCHACNENRLPKATVGITEEFQVGAELYVL